MTARYEIGAASFCQSFFRVVVHSVLHKIGNNANFISSQNCRRKSLTMGTAACQLQVITQGILFCEYENKLVEVKRGKCVSE